MVICTVFLTRLAKPYLGKFNPKKQNCEFKLKSGNYTKLNMQSSMVMFIFFSYLTGSILFGQIWPQSSKLFLLINSNMRNSMVIFTFSIFDQKYPFWVNLVQKSKLSVKAKIWCLHKFEYAKLNGCSQSFCL